MKVCSSCREEKAESDFRHRSGNRSHQLHSECKRCEADKQFERIQDPYRKINIERYQREHKKEAAEKTQRWRERNPEKAKESNQKSAPQALRNWRAKGGPAVLRAKESARLRARGFRDKESKEYYNIIKYDKCSYCEEDFEHIDHIDAVINSGTHKWYNMTASCAHCNASKNNKTLLQFLLYKIEKGLVI